MSVIRWRRVPLVVVLVAACLDSGPTETTLPRPATGLWVFHIAGGRFDTHIQLWNIWEEADTLAPLRLGALPTRWWDGTTDRQIDPTHSAGMLERGEYRWTLDLGAADTVTLRYVVVADSARGTLVESDSGVVRWGGPLPLVGVRLSASIDAPDPSGSELSQADSTPIVVLRMDDIPATDRAFAQRLISRGLYAEIAVPTRWVGIYGRLTWDEIHGLVDQGFTAAAHSRTHGSAPKSDLELMGEVLGSEVDLAAQSLPAAVFIQPGTWADSLDFVSSALYHNWRGSLFRTFAQVMEAYVYPVPRTMPLADSVRMGITHYTLYGDFGYTSALNGWRDAVASRNFTIFMVHTARLPSPGAVDWLLDSLAAAKQAGRIRLAHSTAEVFPP